jgi:hypothetical protein
MRAVMRAVILAIVLAAGGASSTAAQGAVNPNRSSDEYTRYELLDPASASFRIIYDVTAVSPGATLFFNPIRKGSEASDESVIDLMTGAELKFEVVSGTRAREDGLARADAEGEYLKIHLARPVPANGETRIRILKTYRDPKSYYSEAGDVVFARPLGIRRNAVVLPAGYEVVSCNVPVQVIEEQDGRIALSFIHTFPGAADLMVRARKRPASSSTSPATKRATTDASPSARPAIESGSMSARPSLDSRRTIRERARQTTEIVYFLQQPETHSFRLYHDFTETREGTDRYLNVVRRGSTVSNPSALDLDTGEPLKAEILRGKAIADAGLDIGEPIGADSEVVVIRFPPVARGRSTRLRIEETYTDPQRYDVVGGELVWDRAFGRPDNAILLPQGWYLTASAVPATISHQDGLVRLDFVNPRNDELEVFVKARRK